MAQIARKLPSEAMPRLVNCDLGHYFFMEQGHIRFFCASGEKTIFLRSNFLIWICESQNSHSRSQNFFLLNFLNSDLSFVKVILKITNFFKLSKTGAPS